MAIALRSASTTAYGSRTNTTVTVPTGAATGDVIVIAFAVGNSSLVTPSGMGAWTAASTSYTAPDPWAVNLFLWVKPFVSGETQYTITHSSGYSQAYVTAWTGADTSSPFDVTPVTAAQNMFGGSSSTATAPALTIVTAGAQGLIARGSWDGNAITPPSGWTENYDAPVLWFGSRNYASAGSTGTVAVPHGNGSNAYPWGVIHAALRPASAGGTGTLTANTPTVTVDVPTVSWSGTVTAPVFAGSITADLPTVTVAVPDSAWTGAVTPPLFTGTITADTPTLVVDVPTVSWSGTTTVPEFTGTLTADTPTVTIDPPATTWAGTVSDPGAFTGTIDTTTPTVTVDVPTVSWTGTASIPEYVGSLTAETPAVTVAAPTVTWTGSSTVPQYAGTLTTDTPTVTVDVPTVAWAGTVTAPSGATLVTSLPPVTISPPAVAWAGTVTDPTVTGTLTTTTPTVSISTPTLEWVGAVTGGGARDITVTGTLGPQRWVATLTPPVRTGTIRRRWDAR